MESPPELEQAQFSPVPDAEDPCPAATPAPEEVDETWEEKEDKLDAENVKPETSKPVDLKYQYKEGGFPTLAPNY